MSSYLFSSNRCQNCSACCDHECMAVAINGDMVNPNTGEVYGDAVVFHQDGVPAGRTLEICETVASYWGTFCEDTCEYHEDTIFCDTDACYYSWDYAINSGDLERCNDCGHWFFADDVCGGLCESCRAERGTIRRYHNAHYVGFEKVGAWEDTKTIGFELETDGDMYEPEAAAAEIWDTFGDAFFLEEDCSLYNGVEIISQPHTVPALEELDLDRLCEIVDYWGADTCPYTTGLHLHFDRSWFGEDREEQRETIARMIMAYRYNWDALVALSGRDDYARVDEYAARPRGGDTLAEVYDNNNDWRYYAVNLDNYNTVEFRLGAGYVNAGFIRKWIGLHIAMIEAARRGELFTVNYNYTISIERVQAA